MLLGKALDREPGVVYPEKNWEEAAAMQEAQELKQELFRRLAREALERYIDYKKEEEMNGGKK